MLPLGGTREIGSHKGYGLAVIVDILAGVLSGTGPGFLHPRDVSHHFVAWRIDAFRDVDEFKADMDHLLRGLRRLPAGSGGGAGPVRRPGRVGDARRPPGPRHPLPPRRGGMVPPHL